MSLLDLVCACESANRGKMKRGKNGSAFEKEKSSVPEIQVEERAVCWFCDNYVHLVFISNFIFLFMIETVIDEFHLTQFK